MYNASIVIKLKWYPDSFQEFLVMQQKLVNWNIETLRFTGFPVSALNILQTTWWHDLIGQPPESEIYQAKAGIKRIEGIIDIGKLILELAPQRVDWVLTGDDQNPSLPPQNTLGEFDSVLTGFSDLLNKWLQLSSVPNFHRIAIGGILTFPVPDRAEGYRQMSHLLPNVKIDPEGSTDLLYQINRPRSSNAGIPDLIINRLMKWSVATRFLIPITSGNIKLEHKRQDFVCKLEFDINTTADYVGELNSEQARTIYPELFELAIEISQQGDMP